MGSGAAIWTIVITAALSVASTLGVTYFGHRLGLSKDKQLRQDELDRHARYLAIRVVCKLDPFVSECCDIVCDEGLPDQSGEMRTQIADPTISFPEDVEWKSIKPALMYRILGFPNELDVARQSVDFTAEVIANPPDYRETFDERIVQYGQLGLVALTLAAEIRQTYNIPTRNFGDWHPKDRLEEAVGKVRQKRAKLQAHIAEMMIGFAPKATSVEEG